jgi:hypothetical protein
MQVVDIRDILISISVVISRNIRECLDISFSFHKKIEKNMKIKTEENKNNDKEENQNLNLSMISKKGLFHILNTLNKSISFFSDKSLDLFQIQDLVNSVYASAVGNLVYIYVYICIYIYLYIYV